MHDARPRQKWLKRHFGWWFALAVMVPLWLCASGQVTQAYAAGPPPMALLYGWQPLVPHVGASRQRAELRPLAASYKKKRWAKLCNASERLRQRLLHRAAKLFYRPVRQGADTRAIERFLERYVRGASPLLITAGEVFAPAPALRDLAVHGCVRAGKPHLAERFVAQVAIAGKESRLRVALALIRLQKGEPASKQLWLVGDKGGGARAALIRALAVEGQVRAAHIAAANRAATSQERALIAQFQRWLGTGR